MKEKFSIKLKEVIDESKIKQKEALKNYTTLRIGGPADYLVSPTNEKEIENIIKLCKQENIEFFIMGNGSNLLVSDEGYRGLVIHLASQYSKMELLEDGIVKAESGVLLPKLSKFIARQGLSGFEFAEGIPGTLGGAVSMNAGAYGGEIKQKIIYATIMDCQGKISKLDKDQLQLGYRSSVLQKENYLMLEAAFQFEKGDQDLIYGEMKKHNKARRDKQPIEKLSAGSTFKRPVGYYAGKLVSDSGLKGFRIGDISVSDKHCGFLINHGNGSAEDFLKVKNHIIKTVEEKYGVTLEAEIKLLGKFK